LSQSERSIRSNKQASIISEGNLALYNRTAKRAVAHLEDVIEATTYTNIEAFKR
jgi:hypothetical protein